MSKYESSRHSVHAHRPTEPGSAPGQVTSNEEAPPPNIQVIAYGPDTFLELPIENVSRLKDLRGQYPVMWINVDSLGDAAVIEAIGELFELHRLALEDVVHTHQRAKVDDYGHVLYIVLRMADIQMSSSSEQLSLFLGADFVITFQEEPGDCWSPVRARLRQRGGYLRSSGADYLVYALLDAVIDAYFPVLESVGERMEELEEEILKDPGDEVMDSLHEVKSTLVALRRCVWPLRDAMAVLTRDDSRLVRQQSRVYLRDCYDHVVQVIDLVDIYRELAADLRDLYMSSVSNRINEVMRVLTIISTIFIPITFIASIYGMNFQHMPELGWKWGYPTALCLMVVSVASMMYFFARRGWFQGTNNGLNGKKLN